MELFERPGEVEVLLGRFVGLSLANNEAVGGLSYKSQYDWNKTLTSMDPTTVSGEVILAFTLSRYAWSYLRFNDVYNS